MSPNRRGVNVVGEKCDGKKKFVERKVGKRKVAEKKVAETGNKTSPSVTCVRNLGNPRKRVGHLSLGEWK
jgi:hypothetical protein